MMAAVETLPLVYSLSGGMPPETLEVFWMHLNGLAEYVTGNSWPVQAPFDSIGHFRTTVTRQDQDLISQVLSEASARQMGVPARSADAGTEAFTALVGQRVIAANWNPNRPPPVCVPLIRQVRQLIAKTREHPVSTLSLAWLASDPAGGKPVLAFSNQGAENFRLYDCERAEEEARIQVRVRQVAAETPEQSTPSDPIALLRLDPVGLVNPGEWQPAADGEIVVPPGQPVHLEVPQPVSPQPPDTHRRAVLECLVRVSFWRPTPEGPPMLEQGWLMPPPFAFVAGRP
jgi:hypothetical protein